jgi:ankyrin repeat protein
VPTSLPNSENQELWPNTSIHGDISLSQVDERHISYTAMPNSDAPGYSLLGGESDGRNLNTRDSSGRTLLHQAIISRSLKDVEKYISMGSAVDIQDRENNQPLHHAASRGFVEIIHLLLKNGADPNAKGESGRTPLHMSIRFPKATKEILNAYPSISSQDDNGDTPLHLALSSSTLHERPKGSIIERLISAGANVNALNAAQITPFHMMLEKLDSKGKYHTPFVLMFLENNAEISLCTKDGKFPFEVFLDKIGSRWFNTDYKTPSRLRNLDLKMFIARKANIDITLKSGKTLLSTALSERILNTGKDFELGQLLCNTADVNKADSAGNYPLHSMAKEARYVDEEKSLEWAKVLLQRGDNPNRANRAGESPLVVLFAAYTLNKAVLAFASFLLDSGANPMMRDSKDNLPIYYVARAAEREEKDQLLELLLQTNPLAETTDQQDGSEDSVPKDQEWWEGYHQFFQQRTWSNPAHLLQAAQLMPDNVAKTISSKALKLGATKFLQSAKSEFDNMKGTKGLHHQDTRAQGGQIVAILRDCHTLKIEVDESWYHSLLDLFD